MRLFKSPRPALVAAAAAATAMLVTVTTGAGGASAIEAGVYGHWDYPATSTGHTSLEQVLMVTVSGTTRFYAHEFHLVGDGTGYIGIQERSLHERLAIFSLWEAAAPPTRGPGATCSYFSHEGSGTSCEVPYNWQTDHLYKTRVVRTETSVDGKTAWRGSIVDLMTGVETVIGYHWAPAGWQGIKDSVNFIENWVVNDDRLATRVLCLSEQPTEVKLWAPTNSDGTVLARVGDVESARRQCMDSGHWSTITVNDNGGHPFQTLTQ